MRINILCVDDDEDDRFLFEEALRDFENCRFISYENCQSALDDIKNGLCPDVIFLDFWMTGNGAIEFLWEIFNIEACKSTRLVVFSDGHIPQVLKNEIEHRNLSFASKPHSYDALLDLVRTSLNSLYKES